MDQPQIYWQTDTPCDPGKERHHLYLCDSIDPDRRGLVITDCGGMGTCDLNAAQLLTLAAQLQQQAQAILAQQRRPGAQKGHHNGQDA